MTSAEGARILIADDEDSLRWVLEKGLRQAGYEVTSAKDGDSALRAFAEAPFDLVFLDIRMPGMDGLTALGKLRELRQDAHVVVMTAHGTIETAIEATKLGHGGTEYVAALLGCDPKTIRHGQDDLSHLPDDLGDRVRQKGGDASGA